MDPKDQKDQDAEAAVQDPAENLKPAEEVEPGGVSHDDLLAAVSDAEPEIEEQPEDKPSEETKEEPAADDQKEKEDEPPKDDEGHKESSRLGRKLAKADDKINSLSELINKQTETIARLEGQISVLAKGPNTPDGEGGDQPDPDDVATVGAVEKKIKEMLDEAAQARAAKEREVESESKKYEEGYWALMSKEFDIQSVDDVENLSDQDRQIYDLMVSKSDNGGPTEYNRIHYSDPQVDFLINKQAATIAVLQGKKTSVPLREEDASNQQPPGAPTTPTKKKKETRVDIDTLDEESKVYLKWLSGQGEGDLSKFAGEAMESDKMKTTRAKR